MAPTTTPKKQARIPKKTLPAINTNKSCFTSVVYQSRVSAKPQVLENSVGGTPEGKTIQHAEVDLSKVPYSIMLCFAHSLDFCNSHTLTYFILGISFDIFHFGHFHYC